MTLWHTNTLQIFLRMSIFYCCNTIISAKPQAFVLLFIFFFFFNVKSSPYTANDTLRDRWELTITTAKNDLCIRISDGKMTRLFISNDCAQLVLYHGNADGELWHQTASCSASWAHRTRAASAWYNKNQWLYKKPHGLMMTLRDLGFLPILTLAVQSLLGHQLFAQLQPL